MIIFGRVVRWLRGRPVWAGNCYDPGDTIYPTHTLFYIFMQTGMGKLNILNVSAANTIEDVKY